MLRTHNQTAGRRLLLAACLSAILLIPAAGAAPGVLDPSFGTGGKVTTTFGTGYGTANALVLDPDGKFVVAGHSSNGANNDYALARFNPNGSLDASFYGTGRVTTAIGPGHDVVNGLVRQPDGKLVAAGSSSNGANGDFSLARYNSYGSLDTSFNGTGKVMTAIGSSYDAAEALVRQPDGKLVAAGHSFNGSNYDFALARYHPNGSLDTSFNGTGKVTTAIGSGQDGALALVLQPDGKLVAAGYSTNGSDALFALARYNPNGSLDASFNGTGKVTTAMGSSDEISVHALALQPDGKLVAAGGGWAGSHNDLALVRYNPNGTVDAGFGTGGTVRTAIAAEDYARGIALQPDGKLVVVDSTRNGSMDFALVRYNPNGTLDASFGSGGTVTTAIGSEDDRPSAVALQPDGKLVVAGTVSSGSNTSFALVRYLGSTLTVAKAGSGAGTVTSGAAEINCGPACSAPFAAVPVTLIATASPGSTFTGWSGGCTGNGSCTLTMGSDQAATATFESDKALKLKKAGSGAGKVTSYPAGISCSATCAHAFPHGTEVKLTARAAKGSVFAGWSGACKGTGACVVAMSAARSVVATFRAPCVVPKVKGKKLRAAKRALKKAHCMVGKVTRVSSGRVQKGRVLAAKPKQGKKLAPDAKVKLRVSKGRT